MGTVRKKLQRREGVPRALLGLAVLCLVATLLAGCPGQQGPPGPQGPVGQHGPDGEQGPAGPGYGPAVGPGLNVTIDAVVIPEDLLPEVTFSATDDMGSPIGLAQFTGSRDVRFTLAYLDGSGAGKAAAVGQYFNYVTDAANGQATYDHHLADGLSENGDGTITYKFETALPADYDVTATHQLGGQLTRTNPLTGERPLVNPLYLFRPDGAAVTETREISTTATCNACHTRMNIHGSRREFQYCILCHTPQSVDPDTGNSVDMPVLIHKIHMGANLPSVLGDPDADPPVEGVPYQIIGYRNSVHDYSSIHFPQSVNNCTSCHADGQHADAYKENPTIAACGACHDEVDFATGENHLAGAQEDGSCATCHSATAIDGYHMPTPPAKLVLATTADDISVDEVTGLVTFTFSASDTDGNAILDLDDTAKYRAGYLIGWPAEEYETYVGNSNMGDEVTNNGDGTYSYTAAAGEEIPVGTSESFGFVFRGRSHIDADDDPATLETRVPMEKPGSVFFRTDGGEPATRRIIVDDEACAACHGEPFAGHGSDRIGVDVCVVCHNPNLVSEPDVGVPVTVNMKDMIHMIHRGSELEGENGYTTGGHGGDVDFTEIHFPGRLEQCSICHGDHDVSVPLAPEAISTIVAVDDDEDPATPDVIVSETFPERAACTSCHDGLLPNVHALLNTDSGSGVETCAVCHGSGSDFDVELVHNLGP